MLANRRIIAGCSFRYPLTRSSCARWSTTADCICAFPQIYFAWLDAANWTIWCIDFFKRSKGILPFSGKGTDRFLCLKFSISLNPKLKFQIWKIEIYDSNTIICTIIVQNISQLSSSLERFSNSSDFYPLLPSLLEVKPGEPRDTISHISFELRSKCTIPIPFFPFPPPFRDIKRDVREIHPTLNTLSLIAERTLPNRRFIIARVAITWHHGCWDAPAMTTLR